MFEDIGIKVKTLAKFVCWGGIIVSCLFGLAGGVALAVMTKSVAAAVVAGLAVAVIGSVFFWISSWALYAIGENTENTEKLRERLCPAEDESGEFDPDTWAVVRKEFGSLERIPKFYKSQLQFLEQIRRDGSITEEDYQERLKAIKGFMK